LRFGRRFVRLATELAVRRPGLWPLVRRPVRQQFDRLAPVWDACRVPDHLAGFRAGLHAVPIEPRHVLDLGSGTGDSAVHMARRWPAAEVVGVDIAPAMVDEARRKLPAELAGRVRFDEADAARLPYPDGAFDLVALANMIPFFDELARVVAPGGYAVFGFSSGAGTPIYVPPARLRAELGRRGFMHFAETDAGRATAFLAGKGGSE
jgi:ubiquinone/menaquinone biosynthesis C-methylase UbiE